MAVMIRIITGILCPIMLLGGEVFQDHEEDSRYAYSRVLAVSSFLQVPPVFSQCTQHAQASCPSV